MANGTNIDLNSILQDLLRGGEQALGGYISGADVSPWIKGLSSILLGPRGGAAPPFQHGYLPGAGEEYAYRLARWVARSKAEQDRYQRALEAQKARAMGLEQMFRPQYAAAALPTPQEQAAINQANQLQNILQSMYTQATPEYKERLDRLERERIAKTQQDLQNLVAQHERAVARGGIGLLNPERRDEMIAATLARTQDVARDQANERVMADLAKLVQGGAQAFTPLARTGELERARQQAGLSQQMASQVREAQAQTSYEDALNKMFAIQASQEPDIFNIRKQYFYSMPTSIGGMGTGGTGTAGQQGGILSQILGPVVQKGAGVISDALGGAFGSLKDWFTGSGTQQATAPRYDTFGGSTPLSSFDWSGVGSDFWI